MPDEDGYFSIPSGQLNEFCVIIDKVLVKLKSVVELLIRSFHVLILKRMVIVFGIILDCVTDFAAIDLRLCSLS